MATIGIQTTDPSVTDQEAAYWTITNRDGATNPNRFKSYTDAIVLIGNLPWALGPFVIRGYNIYDRLIDEHTAAVPIRLESWPAQFGIDAWEERVEELEGQLAEAVDIIRQAIGPARVWISPWRKQGKEFLERMERAIE